VILGLQAPIRGIRRKKAQDAIEIHKRLHLASHLQRGPTRQSKPTNEALAPTYTEEGPPASDPTKDSGQRL